MISLLAAIAIASSPRTTVPTCCNGMNAFVTDPGFLAIHGMPVEPTQVPSEGKNVTFSVPGSNAPAGNAYWVPQTGRPKIAVVMIHEYWGLNDNIRLAAEKLHNDTGYGVLAVDLYDGKVATDPKTAASYMSSVDASRASSIVAGALELIKSKGFKKIGSIGFCFGGGWSQQVALIGGKNVQACVMYYGMPTTKPEDLAKLKAPVLMVHATRDPWINAKVVGDFQTAMNKTHHWIKVLHYDADHAFANPSNPRYNEVAAKDAYQNELAFFKKNLG